MIKLFFLILFVSSSVWAQVSEAPIEGTPALITNEFKELKPFSARESHWVTTFGFEGLTYEVPYHFRGDKENFTNDNVELWGGRLGFGREFYLGGSFNTTTRFEGYYVGTLFARRSMAGPQDSNVEVDYKKKVGQLYGFEVSQSIGYLIDMKTKNPFMDDWSTLVLEPFIEGGAGLSQGYNKVTYSYATTVFEQYKQQVVDQVANVRIGGGFNLTSGEGVFLYVKAFVNFMDITNRKIESFTRRNGQAPTNAIPVNPEGPKDDSIDPVISYALGGGYKF